MTETVSVVLCTRNGARHLGEQLASISAGTRQPDEVVVLDDDSTDGSVAVVRAWAADRPPGSVRIEVNRPALGVTANFEKGMRTASGSIVLLCDQDDRWHPDRIDAAVRALQIPGALLVHGDAELIDDRGDRIGRTLFDFLGLTTGEREAEVAGRGFSVLVRRNTVTGATAAFRAELLAAALPIPSEWVHDEWLATIAAAQGGLLLDPGIRVDYRLHDRNAIGAERPTLRYRIGRAVRREPGRQDRLAARSRDLLRRVRALPVAASVVAAAEDKVRFEEARAALPGVRILRVPRILRLLASGEYRRCASRGRWDVVRDLLQPR